MNDQDIGYKIKTPCDDCPFKRSTPLHSGVMSDLPMYEESLKKGTFAHTCHKTDKRADGYIDQYNGEVQHCMGLLSMLVKTEQDSTDENYQAQWGLIKPILKKQIKYEDIPTNNDVFRNFGEMKEAYREKILALHN